MNSSPTVSIIIVSYNSSNPLDKCLKSIMHHLKTVSFEVIVIDNASKDDIQTKLHQNFPQVITIANTTNIGFAQAVNQASEIAQGDFLTLLNPDTLFTNDPITPALDHLRNTPSIGIVGAQLTDINGNPHPSAHTFPSPFRTFLRNTGLKESQLPAGIVDWIPFAFAVIPTALFHTLGRLDPRFFLYFEDVDFCYRLKKHKHSVLLAPNITVIHHCGLSAKSIQIHSEVTLWMLQSELLFFHKYFSPLTKHLYFFLATSWHLLRYLIHDGCTPKKMDAKIQRDLYHQAWNNTFGGKCSPSVPWNLNN